MTLHWANKRIVVGVTGSIAAYKSAELVRRLREAGAVVRVVMTENAKRFITPLTMQAVSGYPVHDALFDTQAEAAMGHIELARWADMILVAPATADFMARLARGRQMTYSLPCVSPPSADCHRTRDERRDVETCDDTRKSTNLATTETCPFFGAHRGKPGLR